MLMQAVTTVSLAFAASIFGTFAVTSKYAGEAKSAIAAEPTKVKLATTPEFRTAKPIDQSLVPRAKTTRLPLLGNARQIAPTLPSGPQVHTHQMKDTIAAESTATSELEVDSNPQLEMVLPLHGPVPLPHMRTAADVAWDLTHTRYDASPTRIASASKQPYGQAMQVKWDTRGMFVDEGLFDKIDTDNDGKITRTQFIQAIRGGLGTEAKAKLTKLEALKKAMDGDDTAALRSALATAAGLPENFLVEAQAKLAKLEAAQA